MDIGGAPTVDGWACWMFMVDFGECSEVPKRDSSLCRSRIELNSEQLATIIKQESTTANGWCFRALAK